MKYVIVLILFNSCISAVGRKDFIAKPRRTDSSTAPNLKMDGAYYRIHDVFKNGKRESCLQHFILYRNGIARHGAYCREKLTDDRESARNYIREEIAAYSKAGGSPEFGGYVINNNTEIVIQTIRYITQFHWKTVSFKGRVLNDSTIVIKEYYFDDNVKSNQDEYYLHFIAMEKTDSLKDNRWRNKSWYWQK